LLKLIRVRGFFIPFLIFLSSLIILFLLAPLILVFFMVDYGLVSQSLFETSRLSVEVRNAFLVTFEAATLSTIILFIFGVPLAYLLARFDFTGKTFLKSIIDVPFLLPHAVAGILILIAYGGRGTFASLLSRLGLFIEDSFWGVVAAMLFVSAPILIDTVRVSFESIDPMLEYVARCLGASYSRSFFTISLPLAWRGIIGGFLLAWARAVSEVGALLIVAYYPKTINILIIEWFNTYGLGYALALTVPLIVLSLILFFLVRLLVRYER